MVPKQRREEGEEGGDLILILTRRVALEQKLDSSHLRWSEMKRTYRKVKKEGNEPGEGELWFMKVYVTRPMYGTNSTATVSTTTKHLSAKIEQIMEMVVDFSTAVQSVRRAEVTLEEVSKMEDVYRFGCVWQHLLSHDHRD